MTGGTFIGSQCRGVGPCPACDTAGCTRNRGLVPTVTSPMPDRLSDAELAEIRVALSGRTKYEGRRIPWDERLLADRDALAREVRELREEMALVPAREQAAFTLGAGWGVSHPRDATGGWLYEARRRYPSPPPESP